MEQTQTKQNGRPKLELDLNQSVILTLLKDKPYSGESAFGRYFLYSVRDSAGVEYSFFAPDEIHEKLVQSSLKCGDQFKLIKKAVQNGKRVSSRLEIELVIQLPNAEKKNEVQEVKPDDGYRQMMERSLRDAIEATKAVNTVQFSVEDLKSIALTIFIQRARSN